MSSHYVLKIQYADGRPAETKKLDMAVAIIGRDTGDIVLGDSQSSGRHAELRFANGRLTVRDAGSTNGTFFKGARTPSFNVGPGDSFTIGQTILTVMELVGGDQAPATKGRTMMAMGGVPGRPPGPPPPGGARGGGPPPPGGFRSPPQPDAPAAQGGPAPGGGPRAAAPPAPVGGGAPPPGGGMRPPGAGLPAPGAARAVPAAPAAPPSPAAKLPTPGGAGLPAPGGAGLPSPGGAPASTPAAAPAQLEATPGPAFPTPPAAAFDSPSAPAAVAGAAFSKAVKLALDPVMLPGETIQHTLEADGIFLGPQLGAKIISVIVDWVVRVTGGHIRINMVVTDRRVLVLQSVKMLCGATQMKVVHSVALASVVETGWVKGTELCCINTRAVHLQTKTQRHTFVVRKLGDAAVRDFITQMSAVNVSNAATGTAT